MDGKEHSAVTIISATPWPVDPLFKHENEQSLNGIQHDNRLENLDHGAVGIKLSRQRVC